MPFLEEKRGSRSGNIISANYADAYLFQIDTSRMREPVYSCITCVPGSKEKLAKKYGYNQEICADVAASAMNHILQHGMRPVILKGMIVCGNYSHDQLYLMAQSFQKICEENQVSFAGMEIAAQPVNYGPEDYELSATVVGVQDRDKLLTGNCLREGDVLIGIRTEGIDGTNYPIVKIILDKNPALYHAKIDGSPQGKTMAVVGASGGGKSTLLRLLCGFYRPQQGEILVEGVSLGDLNLEALRSRLSYVSQHAYLFPASVGENIAIGKSGAGGEEIHKAAKAANAAGFIGELPQRYDTLAGERGSRLSGGQIQRISIARAILKDAPILLLDEATSALDVQAEAEVQKALEELAKGRTTLVVAHNPLRGWWISARWWLFSASRVWSLIFSATSAARGGALWIPLSLETGCLRFWISQCRRSVNVTWA